MQLVKTKEFSNGKVHCLRLVDGMLVETTDTFLPLYTKFLTSKNSNKLINLNLGSREERWMVGVSVMSGCPVRCKFCATGNLKSFRNLKAEEIYDQIVFVTKQYIDKYSPINSSEFKINYTRMGEPFLNIYEVKEAINMINVLYPNAHHYISTIGIKDSDFSWISGNVTLQISLHSLDEGRRNDLIPFKNKMTIKELGRIRTKSNLKTTLNLTLVDEKDFDIGKLKEYFDPKYFFVKLSPINRNEFSDRNLLGSGLIETTNLI